MELFDNKKEESQKVNITIADRTYPLRINPVDEETLRAAAKRINESVDKYLFRLKNSDYQDTVSLTLLVFAVRLLKTEKNADLNGLLEEIKLLDIRLGEYLDTI